MKPRFSIWPRKIGDSAWLWLPVLAALALMIPRLLSAQYGLLDDGATALNADKMGAGVIGYNDIGSGRIRPVYWLYFSGLYRLVGNHPQTFFIIHALMLAASVGMLAALVRRVGGSRLQAFLAGLLAVSAGPVIENFYTLSKSEPLQAFLTLAGLLLMLSLAGRKSRWGRGLTFAGATLIFSIAMLSKETYVVMPFIALAGLFLAWVIKPWRPSKDGLRLGGAILAALVIAALVFVIYALPSLGSPTSGTYATHYDFNLSRLFKTLIEWRAWLTRDFLYLLPVGALWLILLILRKSGPAPLIALDGLVFAAAWIVVFLPWEIISEYYLLLTALGVATFAGLVLGGLGKHWPGLRLGWKVVSGLLTAVAVYLWLAALPNQVNNARLQLTVDRINQQMSAYLAETVPQNGRVLVNLTPGSEYTPELAMHLKYFYNRPDIQVDIFNYQTPQNGAESFEYWLVTPAVVNKPVYAVRFGFLETRQRRANALLADFVAEPGAVFSGGYDQYLVRPLQPACWVLPKVGPCQESGAWISRQPLEYNWTIYHWTGNASKQSQPATYAAAGQWQLRQTDGSLRAVRFGGQGDLPVIGDVDGDDRDDLGVYNPSTGSWQFDTNLDGQAEIELTLQDGQTGGQALLGDWDGDGRSSPALYQDKSASWYFYDENGRLLQSLQAGNSGDIPLVGDWNGDGRDTIGVYRPETGEVDLENELSGLSGVDFYAPKQQQPVVGHWAGLPAETLAFFGDGVWQPYYWNRDGEPLLAPASFEFGANGETPLAGRW
ncbi:4-amino-4-deoxy-L-arabinose transferase [Longilinea arvoryzae]|uniref:4-amino-4-deoxy-L-arabinose transferase n=1 Tax=Longilinea arvoryzae TaxID=360412 RepID=A0A0S7B948_9CHLR|nr:glycosyltransferase family 39 protein [Longilinea arvoryzae]GAP13790.1 4-amino-4-deoxy-L-arabinose transferase [Longilinea arvoryzae]